ncbi:lipopolysaccharide biosynthesis protein [Deinococcus sp. YIM 77859]|uniref:lipopolysaccharide biosynthesis protein n=1 Tax=Deinococcus sp. YIM 77859 TaxID=1540221 RepID=UPI000552B2E7|nr:lipopolysaccharide biosynthesis protein [Deinococcus sp. YIM 77859]
MSLKSRTVHAIKWSYVSLGIGTALQLVFAAVLSRLLTPEAFGVVALAFMLQRVGQFVGDLGIGQAIVQKPELTETDIRAGFTSSLLLGALVTVIAWCLAPLAGRFYDLPELVPVFRVYAGAYLLNALIVLSSSLLRRSLRFRPLVTAELTSYILGHGVIGLGTAYLGFGALSVALSALAQAIIQTVFLYAATRHSLRLTLRREAYRPLYAFGTRVTVVNFLEFLSANLDTLLLGRLYSPTALGLYSRSYNTVSGPALNFAGSLTRVLAPSFSAVQTEPERLRRAYHSALLALMLVMGCVSGGIVVAAPEIVRVLLGPQFLEAVPLLRIFGLLLPFLVTSNLSGVLAEATARLGAKIRIQLVYFLGLLLAFWTTYRLGGSVVAIALTLLAATILRNVAFALLARSIVGGGRAILRAYGTGLLCLLGSAAVSFAVVQPLRHLGTPLAVLFTAELLLGAVVLAAAVFLAPPNELQTIARRILPRLSSRWRGVLGPP